MAQIYKTVEIYIAIDPIQMKPFCRIYKTVEIYTAIDITDDNGNVTSTKQ